jgi:hypothetical protein
VGVKSYPILDAKNRDFKIGERFMKYAKRIWLILNIISVAAVIIFFVLSRNFLLEEANKQVMGICYSDFSDKYQRVLNDSIYPAVSERRDILHYKDAARDQSRQNSQIMELVNAGCQLIFVVPVDGGVEEGIRYAAEKGVYVVIIDRMLREEKLSNMMVLSDNYSSGRDLAKYLTANISSANILLICRLNDESANESTVGFEDVIRNLKNDNFKIAGKIYTNGKMMDLKEKLSTYKTSDIDAVFCVDDSMVQWSRDVLDNAYFISIGGSPKGKQMVANRELFATVNQFPSIMGDEAIKGAYNILEGKTEADNIIVPSKIITVNTVDSHNIGNWE